MPEQTRQKVQDTRGYQRTKMQKEIIIQKLKEQGCRITKQRRILLDIILEEECSCCKEIYYKAVEKDAHIGTATVYRMVNTLEEIGAISRKNMYQIEYGKKPEKNACIVELEDNTTVYLSNTKWNTIIQAGLKACGYLEHQKIKNVTFK